MDVTTDHPLLGRLRNAGLTGALDWYAQDRGLGADGRDFDDDLIPDIDTDGRDHDDGLGAWLDRVSLVEAYNRWAGKGIVTVPAGKHESIKVRCPNPLHTDNHPSAWINTRLGDGGVGICRACGDLGFDKYLLFAWTHGIVTPGTPIREEFPRVRREMARELGAVIVEVGGKTFVKTDRVSTDSPSGDTESAGPGDGVGQPSEPVDGGGRVSGDASHGVLAPPCISHPLLDRMVPLSARSPAFVALGRVGVEPDPEPPPPPRPGPDPEPEPAPVIDIETREPVGPPRVSRADANLLIDWEAVVAPGTFLDSWMRALTVDTDIPHEYTLFNGLLAIGAVVKRSVYFPEARHVYPNLMVLLFGDTSTGKSRSLDPLVRILDRVDPFVDDEIDLPPLGTKRLGVFGSGESLISSVKKDLHDPTTGLVTDSVGIAGLAKMEEFSLAVSMARRSGSSFKEYLMSLYDTGSASHTSLSSGDITVSGAYLQVVSTTQPNAVYKFLDEGDTFSGFLNRWVVVSGVNRRGKPLSVHPPSPLLDDQARLLSNIKRWAEDAERPMAFTGTAWDAWDTFYERGLKRVQENGSPLLARWDLTLKKVILLLTANEMLDNPSERIVNVVVEHIFPYMNHVYGLFGAKVVDSERERVFNDVIDYLETFHTRHDDWPTIRDLKKSAIGKRYGAVRVLETCDWAVRIGVVAKMVSPRTTRYALPGV